ncbi:MAG: hypothetical protein JWO36_3543 [Myxococcales bacterium]|nr:hypothetical protein [Myxococcales bacterium]
MARTIASLVLSALVVMTPLAHADQPPESGPEEALDKKIAVWRFDALGIDGEIVQRLETLFRMELDRLDRQPLPTRRDIERSVTAAEQNCTGEEKCLASIGKRLGVDLVVTGTVGSLGDNYVLNIKVVDVATAKSQRMQSDPLRGSPDQLIEGVRVAAYKLLAPQQIYGALQIQSDLVGAEVSIDDKSYGRTPLPNQGVIAKLPLGMHKLRVDAKGYDAFEKAVEVHFQKVGPVLVRLLPAEVIGTGKTIREVRNPIYTRTWFIVGVGLVAIAIGIAAGHHDSYPCTLYVNGSPTTGPCSTK